MKFAVAALFLCWNNVCFSNIEELAVAIQNGDIEGVKKALQDDAINLNTPTKDGHTVMDVALAEKEQKGNLIKEAIANYNTTNKILHLLRTYK